MWLPVSYGVYILCVEELTRYYNELDTWYFVIAAQTDRVHSLFSPSPSNQLITVIKVTTMLLNPVASSQHPSLVDLSPSLLLTSLKLILCLASSIPGRVPLLSCWLLLLSFIYLLQLCFLTSKG